jgi:hypothetical protein
MYFVDYNLVVCPPGSISDSLSGEATSLDRPAMRTNQIEQTIIIQHGGLAFGTLPASPVFHCWPFLE